MTLLQRTPREVYRVFDEDEFLVRGADQLGNSPATPVTAERRLRRIVGTTVLVAAAGAVGGLLAVAGVFSVSGARRRAGIRLFAATVPPSSSSRVETLGGRHLTAPKGSRDAGVRRRSKRVAVSRRARLDVRSVGERRAVSGPIGGRAPALAVVAAPRSRSVEAAPSAGDTPPALDGPQLHRSGRPEFGFER
ncbi:MAG TPA: hypothetical protein VK721_07435 [Solirubrobacteraceae bacterium]|jgi:hypothetical protein|nr:hypothetical protein [Solirubrobacteraceae bacterium]